MPKYNDVNQAVRNYASFDSHWNRIQRDFDFFCEHLENLQLTGIQGFTVEHKEKESYINISFKRRTFSAHLFPQVTGEKLRGVVIFFEQFSDGSTRTVKNFAVDGGGFISDLDQTNSLPAYDASSLQLTYWLNLLDDALSLAPQLTK